MRRSFLISAVLTAGAGLYMLLSAVCRPLFSLHLALLSHLFALLGRLSAFTERPLAEIIIVMLAICTLVYVVRALFESLLRRSVRPILSCTAVIIAIALPLGALTDLMWPAPFERSPRAEAAYARRYEISALAELITQLNGILRASGGDIEFQNGAMHINMPRAELAARAADTYRRFTGIAPAPPKFSHMPAFMRRFRLSGIFIPLTGEAIVNPDDYASAIPFAMLHELAHSRGILREDEANLAAFYAGIGSPYPEFVWSSALAAIRYALNTLRAADESRFDALRARIDPYALRELDLRGAFSHLPPRHTLRTYCGGKGANLTAFAPARGLNFKRIAAGSYEGLTFLLLGGVQNPLSRPAP